MSATEPTDNSKASSGHYGDDHLYPKLQNPLMPQPSPHCFHTGQNSETVVNSGYNGSTRGQIHLNELQNYPKESYNQVPVHTPCVQQCHHWCDCSTPSHPGVNTHWHHHGMLSTNSQQSLTVPQQQACYPSTFVHTHNQGIISPAASYPCVRPNPQTPQSQQFWTSPIWTGNTASDMMLNQFPIPQNHHKQASVQGQYGFQSAHTGTAHYNDNRFPSDGHISVQSQDKQRTHQGILESCSSKTEPTLIVHPNPDSVTPTLKPQPPSPDGSTVRKENRNDNTRDLEDRLEKLQLDSHVEDNNTIAHAKQTFTAGSTEKESLKENLKENHEKRQKESQERHNAGASDNEMEVYKDRFLLSGLTEEIGEETLLNYAEIISGYEVTKTEYSTDLSCVVVTLDQLLDEEDWSQCRKKIASRTIEGKNLKFSHISLAHSICVREKHSMIECDSFRDYFSSPRSGNKFGSRVVRVEATDHLVVVTFGDHSAVENVLAHGKHSIRGQSFNISVYYDNIGYVQERSKVSTTRVDTKLSSHEIQLLEVSGLLDTWLKELTHLEEAAVEDKDKIKLKGTETDIKAVEDKIDQFEKRIVDTSIECSTPMMEYLLSLDGKAHTLAKMKEKKIQSIWFKNYGMLKVIARSKKDLDSTKSWIVRHLFETHHDVSEERQNVIEERLDVLRTQCVKNYGVGSFCLDYKPKTRCIVAVTQHEVRFHIEEELKRAFPEPIPVVKKEMQLPKLIQKFMRKYKTELIRNFGKDEIVWGEDSIILHGKSDSVKSAMEELEKVKKLIHESVCRDMKISLDKAILDCFSNYVERTERCIITWQFEKHPESFGAKGKSGQSGRYYPEKPIHDDRQEKRESDRNEASGGFRYGSEQKRCAPSSRRNRKFISPPRITVTLIKGEIARSQADVIVNVVDKNFSINTGAVSQSIMKLGGKELISECKKMNSHMSEGQYVVTCAGSLRCRRVMHCHLANKDNSKAAEMLIDLVERMLEDADRNGCTSIALPALGTGALLQYDPGVVANSMYNAVHKFEQRYPRSKLKEVQFVLYPTNTVVVQAFQEVERNRDAARMRSGSSSCQTSQGKDLLPKISIVSGELAAQKADVIVNSTNTSLALNIGSVSKSILQAGGELLQSECRDILKRSSLKPGEFAVTNGGKLKCRHVYHACLPAFSPTAPGLLSHMVCNILEKAALNNVESIAFPAFGTGNLKYPSAEVARIMFSAIHDFRRKQRHSLRKVLLVVYTSDTSVLKSFKSEEEKFLKHISVSGAHGKPENHHNNPPGLHGNQHSSQSVPERTLQFGPCKIVVKQGNIAHETVECIVNPINNDMDLRHGSVSKALFHVGGKSFQEKTRTMKDKLLKKRVAGVQFTDQTVVLHVRRDFIEESQKQAMIACLTHGDKNDYKTIAFPVLKTGTGSQVVEEMASDLFSAVTQFFKRQTVISCISVVIYQSAHVQQFYDKAKELVARGTHDIPSVGRETQRSGGCQQVRFTWCSDDPLCKTNVEQKISTLQDNDYFTETVSLPPFVGMKDVSEVEKELPVNIKWLEGKHSINVIGKGIEFLNRLKSLHQMIERKVAEHQHSAYRQRTESVEDAKRFGAGSIGNFSEELNSLAVTTKETIRYDQKELSEASMDSYSSAFDPKKYGNQTYNPHSSEAGSTENASKMSASSTQYEDDSEERANSAALLETSFAVSRVAPPTAHPMKWYYLDGIDEILESYEEVSEAIEQAYLMGNKTYELPDSSGQNYVIDFAKMEEVDKSNPEDKVAVLRREDIMMKDFEERKWPKKWTELDGDMAMITLKASEEEYRGVRQVLETSAGSMEQVILKIERLQNKTLHGRFMAKKKQMGNDLIEKKLWHSCQARTDCIVRINNHGTNLNYCRNNNGEPLGEGIYFSEAFDCTAAEYTYGTQYAFLCRVLVGASAEGKPGLRDPPSRSLDDSSFYDSVVDSVQNPSTYVIFSDAQVYPEYLVTYKVNKK